MRNIIPVQNRHVVKNYNKLKPVDNRYYFESNVNILKSVRDWGHIKSFFRFEYHSILEKKFIIIHKDLPNYENTDILFEYLVINAVTSLEVCLKFCCHIYVKKFPEKAKQLLKTIDDEKNLSIQILSNYSFTNVSDIEHVFSTLWGKNYFQVLRHRSEESKSSIGYEDERPNRGAPLFKKMRMFKQLLKLRNELVHENIRIKIKSKKVRKNLLTTIYDVVYHTYSEQYYLPYDEDDFKTTNSQY